VSPRRVARLAAAVVVVAALVAGIGGAAPRAAGAVSLLALPDTLSIRHDRTTSVPAPGVLANDVTVLGTTAVLDSQPSHGSVTLASNGGYTYDPDPLYVGTDVFRYHDFDGLLSTLPTTVTITITNAVPVAKADSYSANAGVPKSISAAGVLKNDTDADGDGLVAQLASGPAHGTVSLDGDGGFTYTADSGYNGDDVFTYVATDEIANSATAEVRMNVSASGSTPRPSTSPSPRPSPTPTPAPTLPLPSLPLPSLPLPSLPLPSLPLPTLPLPSLPLPTARPTPSPPPVPSPTGSPRPDPSASTGPGPSGAPGSPPPGDPGATPTDSPGPGGPGAAGGPGAGPGAGGAGGAGGGQGSNGGGTDADGPVFRISGDAPGKLSSVPLVGAEFTGFDSIDWAVPALTLTVPGLLVMLAVLAQLSAGAIWLPVVRRWLDAFGLGRRRRRPRPRPV
jgi:VCBS repeat-containing protein